jgi:pyroglutamyl-peptidase
MGGKAMARPALITGFMPYAGRGLNPAAEIAGALGGKTIADTPVVARLLPVSLSEIVSLAEALIRELNPCVVISVGLWPGEPVIRVERVGLNIADFEIADNLGHIAIDAPVLGDGAIAKLATVPIRAIEQALLDAEIPARISSTAGTFLCNACLYSFLTAAEKMRDPVTCGFVHVPYLPSQVAEIQRSVRREAILEAHQRADMASMDLATGIRALQTSFEVAIRNVR